MKLSTPLALISAVAAASERQAVLRTSSSSSPDLNDKALSNIHEGAGLNGAYLTESSESPVYYYNATTNGVYTNIPSSPPSEYYARILDNTLIFGIAGDPLAEVNDGYLTVNGSADVFYACKPGVPYDPYGYSKDNYGIAVFGEGESVPDTCESLKISVSV